MDEKMSECECCEVELSEWDDFVITENKEIWCRECYEREYGLRQG